MNSIYAVFKYQLGGWIRASQFYDSRELAERVMLNRQRTFGSRERFQIVEFQPVREAL